MEEETESFLHDNSGMITIEVSVIVPVLTLLIVGIVFFFLFFLDMSVAKSETKMIGNEVAAGWKTEGELVSGVYNEENLLERDVYFLIKEARRNMQQDAKTRVTKRIKDRLCITKIEESSVIIKANKVVSMVRLSFRWPLSGLYSYFENRGLSFSCSSEVLIDHGEEWLRILG